MLSGGRRPARRVRIATAIAAAAIAAFFVVAGQYYLFGVLLPWQTPTRLHVCGRTFAAGPVVTATSAQLVAQASVTPGQTVSPSWHRYETTLLGRGVFGVNVGAPSSCPAALYISTGTSQFQSYPIEPASR